MISATASDAYKEFLKFFTLAGRQRMEGIDKSCFENMTQRERDSAFDLLKDQFIGSEESIRGMFLCDREKAISEFEGAIRRDFPEPKSKREKDNFEFCRAVMLNYICQEKPSAENIDRLVLAGGSANEDTRSYVYQVLPSLPTTQRVVELLKAAIYVESERIPQSSAISKLMEIYGYETDFDPDNAVVKDLYLKLRNGDAAVKKMTFEYLERNFDPVFVS